MISGKTAAGRHGGWAARWLVPGAAVPRGRRPLHVNQFYYGESMVTYVMKANKCIHINFF